MIPLSAFATQGRLHYTQHRKHLPHLLSTSAPQAFAQAQWGGFSKNKVSPKLKRGFSKNKVFPEPPKEALSTAMQVHA
jgi:hypothetical protein